MPGPAASRQEMLGREGKGKGSPKKAAAVSAAGSTAGFFADRAGVFCSLRARGGSCWHSGVMLCGGDKWHQQPTGGEGGREGRRGLRSAVPTCDRLEHTCTHCLVYELSQLQSAFCIKYLNTILSAVQIISYKDPDLTCSEDTVH